MSRTTTSTAARDSLGRGRVMPVTYSLDVGRKLLRTTCSSPTTLADVVEHFRTLARDPSCKGDVDVLLDLRATDLLPEASQFNDVKAEIAALRKQIQFRIFAVVASQDAMFGMMRMFEVLAGQHFRSTRVFRDYAEAEAWLASEQAASDADQ